MKFTFMVEVEADLYEGRRVTHDTMSKEVFDRLQDANPSGIEAIDANGNKTHYEITNWTVEELFG